MTERHFTYLFPTILQKIPANIDLNLSLTVSHPYLPDLQWTSET